MPDKPEMPKAQEQRIAFFELHRFMVEANNTAYMTREDGQRCIVDVDGMVYYMKEAAN